MKRLFLLLLVSESVFLIGDDRPAAEGSTVRVKASFSSASAAVSPPEPPEARDPADGMPEPEEADPDAPRRNDAEPIDILRYKLQEIKNRGKTITFCGKDGKRRELCRIQRISANGLTIKINRTTVYVPYKKILRLLDGVLTAPSFAWIPKKTREEQETPDEAEYADVPRTFSVPRPQLPPDPGLPDEIAFPRRTGISAADHTSGSADDSSPREGIFFYNRRGHSARVWKR